MDGERQVIPLNTPFDINSNDMLVPMTQPKFAFNRQKFLGSLLPTSVRYEADGYFAGWWGHNFEIGSTRDDYVTPALDDNNEFQVFPRVATQGFTYYIARHRDTGLQYTIIPETWQQWLVGNGTVTRTSDGEVTIVGNTRLGSTFTVVVDAYDGSEISFNSPDPALFATCTKEGLVHKVVVDRNQIAGTEYLTIRKGRNVIIKQQAMIYRRDAVASNWGTFFRLDDATLTLTSTDPEFEILSQVVNNANMSLEYVRATIVDRSHAIITTVFEFQEKWTADLFVLAEPITMYTNSSSIDEPCNRQEAELVDYEYTDYNAANGCVFRYMLPIWIQQAIHMPYHVSFAISPDPVPRTTTFRYTFDFDVDIRPQDISVVAKNWILNGPTATDSIDILTIGYTYTWTKINSNTFDLTIVNMPRYTEVALRFVNHTAVTVDWQPYAVELNPAFSPRPRIANPQPPSGCIINSAYQPRSQMINVAKFEAAKDAINPDSIPDTIADPSYNYLEYIDNRATPPTGHVANPAYQPNPLAAAYDPRPVVQTPIPASWTSVSDNNTARDTNETRARSDKDITRYWLEVETIRERDWVKVSQYWMAYWDEIHPIVPTMTPSDIPRLNEDGYVVVDVTKVLPSTIPDTYEEYGDEYYVNQPVDANGVPAPPNEPPYIADLYIGFERQLSSFHAVPHVTEETTNPAGTTSPHVRWQWAIKGRQDIFHRYWVPYNWGGGRYVVSTGVNYWDANGPISQAQYNSGTYMNWKDMDVTFSRTVHDRDVSPSPGLYYNDSWTLYLRCFNVNDGNVPLPTDGNYFTLTIPCNGNFRINQNLMAISSKYINIPSYAAPYNNYSVINTISRTDPNIWGWANGTAYIRIPLCVRAYSYVEVTTPNILLSDKPALAIRTVGNGDPRVATRCWRIDDAGTTLQASHRLNLVQPNYTNLTGINATSKKMMIVFETIAGRPFYSLKVTSVNRDTTTNEIIGYTSEAFPRWMLSGQTRIYDASDVVVPYVPSQDTMTIAQVTVNLRVHNFIYNATQEVDRTPKTIYNELLFASIVPGYSASAPQVAPTAPLPQTIQISLDATGMNIYTMTYDVENGEFTSSSYSLASWTDRGITFSGPPGFNQRENKVVIEVRTLDSETFIADFYRTFILETTSLTVTCTIVSQSGPQIVLSPGFGYVDLQLSKLIDPTIVSYIISEENEYNLKMYVGINNSAIVYFVPMGIVARNNNIEYVDLTSTGTHYNVRFIYQGNNYVASIDRRDSAVSYLQYFCTDIRDGSMKEVYRRDLIDVYMFIKQFWSNDVSVENYWWLDANHVLELNKYDVVLRRKVDGRVHDWNGDEWEDIATAPRAVWFETTDLYYGVSSSQGTRPRLFKLRNYQEQQLEILYADILDSSFNFTNPVWTRIRVPVTQIPFGSARPTNAIAANIQFNIDAMIRASKISSTVRDGNLIIGIAYDRGLHQWTIKIPPVGEQTVVTGYGHVGVNGDLTGGQIPTYCCGATGFNGVVQAIDALPEEAGDVIPEMIVGTDSTVWFVRQNVPSIISHMLYANGSWSPEPMYLNNNISEMYQSVSFGADRMFDIIPFGLNIASIFTNNTAMQFLASIITPTLWTLNPKYTMFGSIAHSVGQYAYVWRNKLQPQLDHLKTDSDVSFGKKLERNVVIVRDSSATTVIMQIVIKAIGNVVDRAIDSVANRAQNQSMPEDKGRKFSQFAVDNVMSTVAAGVQTTGFTISLKSRLQRIRTLSMFYSISNKTECWAGPGFVNHNMQGQCVAQSITDTQVEGKRIGFWAVFADLSTIIEEQKLYLLELTAGSLSDWIQGVGSSQTGSSPGPNIPTGVIIAGIAQAALIALHAMIALTKIGVKAIPALASTVGGYPTGIGYLHGMVTKRDMNMEGTHSYGNKSMSMFWPAFGIRTPNTYTDERVVAEYFVDTQRIDMGGNTMAVGAFSWQNLDYMTVDSPEVYDFITEFKGNVATVNIYCKGESEIRSAPVDMAIVEGTATFLSPTKFKNEQIGVAHPTFTHPPLHDYEINKEWSLGFTAIAGEIVSVSCDDTKLIDGPPSNIVILPSFCGIASSYIAMEIKNLFDPRYLRPVTITPTAVALNINRINCVHNAKAYHAFDGHGNRIIKWTGGVGMDKELLFQQYLFQINDHFKRSSIWPPSQFYGIFNGPPSVAMRSYEPVANLIQELTSNTGIVNDVPGEQKSLQRFSIPVHSEPLSTLPAVNRMLAPYKLHVVEGITSLTTDIRNTQTRYKAPSSVDFNINGLLFRATDEFVCELMGKAGALAVTDQVACAGLTFIGATTKQAFFYSPATKLYYTFTGDRDMTKNDVLARFKSLDTGRWDFINQEVMFKCLLKDEVLVLRLDGQVLGEVWPPNPTIYNERSGFKLFSVAGGLTFQGPKRFIVSRFITLEHMVPQIRSNKRKWRKVDREEFNYERDYGWAYQDFDTQTPIDAVYGWTHNPFLLVTAMLGTTEASDNKFEWTLTWAWTPRMEEIFDKNEYATVNIMAETITQGGVVVCRPTHLFLFKEAFQRSNNPGYYTFKFQSNNGVGNREKLYIWSDSYIALEDLTLDCKQMSSNRTQPLHTQVDVQDLVEL